MNIKQGDIIRHGTFMDVAILIHEVIYNLNETVIYCRWVNQGYNDTKVINTPIFQMIIWPEQKNQWFKCKDPDMKCIRYSYWEQFQGAA
jgi:hypothetical protein